MSESADGLERALECASRTLRELRRSLNESFFGHGDLVHRLLAALVADGHVLLEGPPGLGKTTLVRALATGLELDFQRIQCTPDLMPGDILGTRILEEADGERRFVPMFGPIFTNLLLVDEVNRATPRTQSALLEAMAERQITLFGERHVLEPPFLVIATQNPIEMEGTYPLPEAQLDRFSVKLELSPPGEAALVNILEHTTGPVAASTAGKVPRGALLKLQELARRVPAAESVLRLAARIVLATDPRRPESPELVRTGLRYGAGPRGAQHLVRLAKAEALIAGREFASSEDLLAGAREVLRHRLVLNYEGEAMGLHPDRFVDAALEAVTH